MSLILFWTFESPSRRLRYHFTLWIRLLMRMHKLFHYRWSSTLKLLEVTQFFMLHGKFSLLKNELFNVFRLLGTGDTKSLSKREIMAQDLSEICVQIIRMMPDKDRSTESKAALYLLSLLTYGTVLIHRTQVEFLQSRSLIVLGFFISGSFCRRCWKTEGTHSEEKFHFINGREVR